VLSRDSTPAGCRRNSPMPHAAPAWSGSTSRSLMPGPALYFAGP
jgi:hypothetical protein